MPEPTNRRPPMAVTGMGGLFPGANDVEAFWQCILSAQVAQAESQEGRWGVPRARYLGPPGTPDRAYADAAFTIVLPEAGDGDSADPQVRAGRHAVRAALADAARAGQPLLLDGVALVAATSWSAPSYFGHDAAQHLGLAAPAGPAHAPEAQLAALAPELGGPRLAVDTACASSLYALDLAAGLLESGQARAVVVLGLNVLMPPFLFIGFSKLMALSPASRIAPFAADASGIVPGECAAALVLEPLHLARAAGRQVVGLVRAVGLAADGAERSVFAPGADGQRLAYERAFDGLDRHAVDYVEAHGTATTVGDETEIHTLQAFFGAGRDRPLPIGSVKGLIGHTLAAAGIASVIKGLKMLATRTLPPHLPVTPHAGLADTLLTLATAPQVLGELGRPMRVGISGFGFGGANAHVVLEEAPTMAAGTVAVEAAAPAEALAIVDFEAAFASVNGAASLAVAARGGEWPAGRFPATLRVDAQGLRMGPNFLRRLDPLQLLATHLTRELLARHPGSSGSAATGIVLTSNLGGEMSLRLSRKYAALFADRAAAADAPETSIEAIASALPTMCSGYPAYHLDLRGFHETLAGEPGSFWTSLRLAPRWLAGGCQALVLGAARQVKSPLEAQQAGAQDGVGLFLLKTEAQARAAGEPLLALLRPLAPGLALPAACAQAGLDLATIALRLRCELHQAALAEAAGVELLAQALLAPERRVTIEVCRQGQPVQAWVLDKDAAFSAVPRQPQLPLEICFAPHGRAADVSLPASPATESGASAARWAQQAGQALQAFFAAQRRALDLLQGPGAALRPGLVPMSVPALPPAVAMPDFGVLQAIASTAQGLSAELRVDEEDPYFFDHALDHVPGILMVEGIVQLALHRAPGHWVRRLALKFRRFCEKQHAVRIELLPRAGGLCFGGQVLQHGQAVGSFEIELGAPPLLPVGIAAPVRPVDQPQLLHKRHAANVLVGPLAEGARGHDTALVPPPAGHRFAHGAPGFHGPLYLLETARQAVMLGAHGVMGIPLGLPMNLLALELRLAEPAPRAASLAYRLQPQPLRKVDTMTLADVRTVLLEGERVLGEVLIKAQVVDAGTYEQQRGREPAPQAGAAVLERSAG
ncbi:hypothetical protein LRH25_08545 [Ideonella azotifigens]|uniref:Ketosynthase family 3 (KS3) domain-containing protein n=1 Tax=Ideonella azotifigens TaxID=513160 RepID=A0ABN1KGF6_9BURK|nr:beta-ketoacyl synthase N-terminal-like domain-containing protein [Ideonella azotifigens]MCD2340391.1 hypothetical protein [Ideonella azotifigens]